MCCTAAAAWLSKSALGLQAQSNSSLRVDLLPQQLEAVEGSGTTKLGLLLQGMC